MIMISHKICLATVFLSLTFGCVLTAQAHPSHASIAEAEWNGATGKLEVALQVHPSDLERALRRRTGRRVVLETTPKIDRLIQDYLGEVFLVKNRQDKRVELKWVGKEISIKKAWLYFEVPLRHGPEGRTFSNRIFFELLDDQVNTINFRVDDLRKSLSFTRERAERKLMLDGPPEAHAQEHRDEG